MSKRNHIVERASDVNGGQYVQTNPSYNSGYEDGKKAGKEYCASEISTLREQVEKLTDENGRLRNALVGLVGSDSRDELQSMELAMRVIPASDADVVASVNAIHALLETMQEVSHE